MDASGDTPTTSGQFDLQNAELAALGRMLTASEGTFSFSIAVCNSPSLRDYLISKIRKDFPSVAVIELDKEATDILHFVRNRKVGANSAGIFLIGIEKLLPSDRKEHRVLRALNLTREAWQSRFSCPVIFWLPEYAATLLSIYARDLWSWMSHTFEFVSEQATAVAGTLDSYAGDIMSAGKLDADQKRFRIAELEQRIEEAGVPPSAQLAPHVLAWLHELAYIYRAIGDLDAAEEYVLESLRIAQKCDLQAVIATGYSSLGLIYRTRGDLDKAEQMHTRALEISKKLGRLEVTANQCGNLGAIYLTRGDLDKADEMFHKVLDIENRLGRLDSIAHTYGNLGLICQTRGDLDEAEQMHTKALEFEQKLGRFEGMASEYSNLGLIYQTRGDLNKAEQMHSRALEIERKLGRLEGMARQYGNLGVVNEARGDFKKAGEYWEKALGLFQKIGMKLEIEKTQKWIDGLKQK